MSSVPFRQSCFRLEKKIDPFNLFSQAPLRRFFVFFVFFFPGGGGGGGGRGGGGGGSERLSETTVR